MGDYFKDKYYDALEKAKALYDNESSSADAMITCETIFPELAESEDKRIRKALITFFQRFPYCGIEKAGTNTQEALDWLEKQKNIDVLDKEEREFADNVDSYRKDMDEFYKKGYNAGREAEKQYWLEKQESIDKVDNANKVEPRFKKGDLITNGYYRCKIESVDDTTYYCDFTNIDIKDQNKWMLVEQETDFKLEPKFKVGDWIASNIYNPAKIIGIDGDSYEIEFIDGSKGFLPIDYIDKTFHLWTIEDAKDGDVLNANGAPFIYKKHDKNYVYFYCGLNLAGEFIIDTWDTNNAWDDNSRVYPATKERHDLLFKRMKEAGYEWNAEKKELKKIEDGSENYKQQVMSEMNGLVKDYIKQKPSWSEEDEDAIGMAIIALEDMYDEDAPNTTYGGYNLPFNKAAERLKLLKDRVIPQSKQEWTEEDELNLKGIIAEIEANKNSAPSYDLPTYDKYLNWLKSFKNK